MRPRNQAREWLDQRCGRRVHVETTFVHSTQAPLVNAGTLSRHHRHDDSQAPPPDPPSSWHLYQVGTVSYNLADLAEGTDVEIRAEPAEQLEIIFDDGTAMLIKRTITVMTDTDDLGADDAEGG
jgi:hypothetical protein